MSLSATITYPTQNLTNVPLNSTPVAGYTCTSSPDGTQLFFRYWIDDVDDPTGPDQLFGNPPILGPHTITVSDGTVYNLTEKQPRTHFRHPALTSVVKQTPKWLVDNDYMFPFGAPGFTLGTVNQLTYDGPNGFAGLTRAMGTTGERPDIGLVTDWTADYMIHGDPTNLLITAEVASNAPMFYIDKNTGKPIDKLKYPKANDYGGGPGYRGSPFFQPAGAPYGDPVCVAPDISHFPEISYIAALITQDPWHLFNLQGWVEFIVLTDADSTPDGTGPVIFAPSIPREFAWGLRTIAMAEVATKYFESLGILPANCLPSSYYATFVANSLQYYVKVRMNGLDNTNSPDPVYNTFNILETLSDFGIEPWQVEYNLETFAWMVLAGFTDWNPVFLWALGNPIARTEGGNGFPASYPCPYWLYLGAPGARLTSWAEAWTVTSSPQPGQPGGVSGGNLGNLVSQAMLTAVTADPYCGGTFAPGTDVYYPQSTRGVFSMALWLHGIKKLDVLTPYPQLPTCYANVQRMFVAQEASVADIYLHAGYSYNLRDTQSFDTTLLPPAVVQQLDPGSAPTPPPAGTISMSGNGNLTVGSSEQLNLTFDDGHGNPSEAPTNLKYTETPAGIVTLTPNATGVDVTGAAAGTFTVTATADNGLTTSISGTVALPLAGALHLAWA